jgi:MYXO-CTERM domain-containing protein
MTRYRHHLAALLTMNAGLFVAAGAQAGTWTNDAPFGATLKGDLYTPTTPAASPAILVVIHMCSGHSSTVHGWFDSYADQQGFYLIAPDAGKNCFDSSASRDGDKAAIVKMVDYVVSSKNADKKRVFAAGMSSGGCMTNTLLAIYPDVFVGGSAMPGFPAGGWPSGDTVCSKCGSSPPSTDGKYWGDIARNVFPWSGTYPCSQQWVGGGDEYNFHAWLPAASAQFQNLGNLGSPSAGTGAPSGWTRTVYKDSAGNVRLETNLGPTSQMHNLMFVTPPLYGQVVTFLGLDKPTGACGVSTTGSGGAGGSGGANAGSGGASAGTGGLAGEGGTANDAGAAGDGGTSDGGSSTSSAGSPADAGDPGTSVGGESASGGSTGQAGSSPSSGAPGNGGLRPSDTPPDCSCSLPGQPAPASLAGLLAVALGALFVRRRRARG